MAIGQAGGFVCCLIAVLCFGSNFVPVKRFETYDGMFYQWVMCCAIWIWGLLVQLVLMATQDVYNPDAVNASLVTSPHPDAYSVKFFPFAALGGALWATGNTMAVPIINTIGLGLGLLIWGAANMLMGWATGAFGLFGLQRNTLAHPTLNYIGVGLAVVALGVYSQIKASVGTKPPSDGLQPLRSEGTRKPDEESHASADPLSPLNHPLPSETADELPADGPSAGARSIGVLAAIGAGLLFGATFTPPTYMEDNGLGPDKEHPLAYVFSHYTGIFATSTFWFLVYCAVMKSNPRINPRLVVPGFVSGLMWALASTCWFIANNALQMSIAFPIITSVRL